MSASRDSSDRATSTGHTWKCAYRLRHIGGTCLSRSRRGRSGSPPARTWDPAWLATFAAPFGSAPDLHLLPREPKDRPGKRALSRSSSASSEGGQPDGVDSRQRLDRSQRERPDRSHRRSLDRSNSRRQDCSAPRWSPNRSARLGGEISIAIGLGNSPSLSKFVSVADHTADHSTASTRIDRHLCGPCVEKRNARHGNALGE